MNLSSTENLNGSDLYAVLDWNCCLPEQIVNIFVSDHCVCTDCCVLCSFLVQALDCFTAMLSGSESRLQMAETIGSKLNISKEQVP